MADKPIPFNTGRKGSDSEEPKKPELPPLRTFQVRRPTFDTDYPIGHPLHVHPTLVEFGVEAHAHSTDYAGSLIFETYCIVGWQGEQPVIQKKITMIMAPGTWYDLREVSDLFVAGKTN